MNTKSGCADPHRSGLGVSAADHGMSDSGPKIVDHIGSGTTNERGEMGRNGCSTWRRDDQDRITAEVRESRHTLAFREWGCERRRVGNNMGERRAVDDREGRVEARGRRRQRGRLPRKCGEPRRHSVNAVLNDRSSARAWKNPARDAAPALVLIANVSGPDDSICQLIRGQAPDAAC